MAKAITSSSHCRSGSTRFEARKAGFTEEVRTGVHLVVGQSATVDMELQVGESSQQVTVNGDAPLVGVTTEDISGLVGEQQVKDLPLNGRSYDELLTLNPGVVNFTWEKTGGIGVSNSTVGNNFAVSGNRPQQNLFLLNGVEFTGAAENNMQPGGTSQQLLGVDAVREFNVLHRFLRRGVRQTSRRPGADCHPVRHQPVARVAVRVPAKQRPGCSQLLRPRFRSRLSAQPVRRLAGRADPKEQDLPVRQLRGISPAPASDRRGPGSRRQRAQRLSALQAGQPGAEPLPGLGTGVRRRFAADQRLARAKPRRAGFRGDFRGVQQSPANDSGRLRDGPAGPHFLFQGLAERGLTRSTTAPISRPPAPTCTARTWRAFASRWPASRKRTFSPPSLLNTARAGFSRAGYFFTGEPTPGTPAASLPGFLAGRPIGALVVGGSAASNPTAQLSLAGSNNGSNLDVARNLFTYEDRVSFTKGRHQFNVGAWFQRLQSNENLALSQYGQATFTSLQTFLQGTVGTLLYDPAPTPLGWRSWFGAWYAEDVDPAESEAYAVARLPRRVHQRMERGAWPGIHLHVSERRHLHAADHRKLGLHGEQREIPAAAASRPGVESFRQQAHDRDSRRVRHVQRSAGCAGLPHRSERAVQPDLQPSEPPGLSAPDLAGRRRFRPPPSWFPAECSRI